MRPANSASAAYVPMEPPSDPKQLPAYLREELRRVSAVVGLLAAGHLDRAHVEPSKPRDGDIRLADGSNWDPGSGRGLYYYDDSVPGWVFLA